jgi:hypothetical protein
MTTIDKQLDYQQHLEFYRRLGHLTGDAQRDAFWHRKAEETHCLYICNAILDVHIGAVALAQSIVDQEANLQLRFGVSRRTKFIWLSLRRLFQSLSPERTEPLIQDDVEQAAQDLNVIYINIRGTLDNFAWCLRALFGHEETRRLPPAQVHLFNKKFLKDTNFNEVALLVDAFQEWNSELKERRDPAAHRIPLSVPPAILDALAQQQYAEISAEHAQLLNATAAAVRANPEGALAYFEKLDLLHDRLQRLGTFVPLFVHHPDERPMKIYPTVPQDIGELVKVTRGLMSIIIGKLGQGVKS